MSRSPGPGGVPLLVRASLRHHALSTAVTVLSTALAAGLVLAVFSIQEQSRRAFGAGPLGFDAVLGARGSPLQLVLNAVFHLETSPGNLPWSLYQAMVESPHVEAAVPYATGDNYRGFRIVGTSEALFEQARLPGSEPLALAEGRRFAPDAREAVVGDVVARRAGLGVGDVFHPYHGLVFDEDAEHEDRYEVVGVLAPTNTPVDRVLWIPLAGLYRMEGHVLRGDGTSFQPEPGHEIPDAHKEVSAVLLRFRTPQAGFLLDQTVNKQGRVATLAWPIGQVMADFFDKLGWLDRVLVLVAWLVAAVAAGSILAAIHNSMNERRRELAVLRALGARRRHVVSLILGEATALGVAGAALGFGVYAAIFAAARAVVRAQTGVVLDPWVAHPVFVLGPVAIVLLAAAAGAIPAIQAYRTDVASHLSPA